MPRIGYDTAMMAYDDIAAKLKASAGKDGVVSRADAKATVRAMRKEGLGNEAQIASNMFKIIDSRDNADGARVTGYDFAASRNFFKNKMLEGYDKNHNGWSKAEMAKMSPTGQAIIKHGLALKLEKKAGRIGYATPETGMRHIASLINDAAGKDGVTSRKDIRALSTKLYKAGRNDEALAMRYFFNFIDHRDYKVGARVTMTDVRKAVEYSGTHLLTKKDQNHNGYSKAEYAKFSTTAKAFTLVGKMIEAGIIKA